MRAAKVVRRVDELGRIVLPADVRKQMELAPRDAVEIFTEDDKIILRKYEPSCIFCGNAEDTVFYGNKRICRSCIAELKSLK